MPQGAQPHVLLVAGMRALDELFGGVQDELIRCGAVTFEAGTGLALYRAGGRWPAEPLGLHLTTFGRPLLELILRRRVARHPHVTVRDRVAVSGLTGESGRVTGAEADPIASTRLPAGVSSARAGDHEFAVYDTPP